MSKGTANKSSGRGIGTISSSMATAFARPGQATAVSEVASRSSPAPINIDDLATVAVTENAPLEINPSDAGKALLNAENVQKSLGGSVPKQQINIKLTHERVLKLKRIIGHHMVKTGKSINQQQMLEEVLNNFIDGSFRELNLK